MKSFPLVSCIMPTYNRRKFVPQAINYFLKQDYPNRELIIIDDGSDSVKDLIPTDPIFKYIPLNQKITIGAKRNLAVELSRADIIVHWDDDDWHAKYRIRYQVENLLEKDAEICGINKLLFFNLRTKQLWLYEYPKGGKIWLAGGALCYRKSFWQKNIFVDVNIGEDTKFVLYNKLENALILSDFKFYLAMIHSENTSPKTLKSPYWKRWDENINKLLGKDISFYLPESLTSPNNNSSGC